MARVYLGGGCLVKWGISPAFGDFGWLMVIFTVGGGGDGYWGFGGCGLGMVDFIGGEDGGFLEGIFGGRIFRENGKLLWLLGLLGNWVVWYSLA